jgi:putative toxin-antitoxin system antitoxin component (TIGR02293 family)
MNPERFMPNLKLGRKEHSKLKRAKHGADARRKAGPRSETSPFPAPSLIKEVLAPFDCTRAGDSVGQRYDSLLDAVKIVNAGLLVKALFRLQKTSGLTAERIKQVARISEGSFARRKQAGRLSPEESERLLRVSRVFERATALHEGDVSGARQWLETPIPALGNQRPLDLARTEPGAREVEDLIGRIEYGIVS